MQSLFDLFKKLGAGRIAAMAAVTVALIAFFGFVIMRFSEPTMVPLYTNLDMRDSSAIVRELESAAVQYTLRGDGTTILVPSDLAPRLRMTMASNGLPSGGGIGYEIFDKGDGLSTTSFVQNINQLRALEGELSRTIRSIDRVDSARVHLVIPERALFSRDKETPSASIVVEARGGLEPAQIRAIRHMVASAVEGLKPERISIVDSQGRLLADGAMEDGGVSTADERNVAFEKRLTEQVSNIVERVVGIGRAKVQVTAEIDFNKVTQTQDLFDPDSRVVRSTQTREETANSSEPSRDGSVSVGNELPAAAARNGNGQSTDQSNKTEETVNYEISRTTKTEIVEAGRIKRVSVAVLVDGVYQPDANGNVAYSPRTQEEIDRITALVRSAIGFDQNRGDLVEVVNLRFADGPSAPPVTADAGWMSMFAFTKDDIMRMAELGVLGLLALLVLLFVVRPLVRKVMAPEVERALAAVAGTAALPPGAPAGTPIPGIPGAVVGANGKPQLPDPKDNPMLKQLDLAQVNGEVQAKSLERIGELAERNPNETVQLIRTWLATPA